MKYTNTCQSNDSKLTTKNSISGCDYNIMINIGTPPCSILKDKCDGRVTNLRDKKIIEEDDKDPTSEEEDDKERRDKKIIEEDDYGVKDNNEKVINVDRPYVILKQLPIASDIITGYIIDYETREPTGQKIQDCLNILSKLDILKSTYSGKILGKCGNDISCRNCVDAINVSVLPKGDTQHNLDEDQYYFGDQMSL